MLPARRIIKCQFANANLHRLSQPFFSATKALGKMQHEDWIDAGEALGRDDLKGVQMPGGRAKDLSHTFPRPSVKVEDIWNEVCSSHNPNPS